MEDKTLICKINMFDEFQYLEFRDSSSIGVPFDELKSVLPAFCHEHGYEKIHFFGNESRKFFLISSNLEVENFFEFLAREQRRVSSIRPKRF